MRIHFSTFLVLPQFLLHTKMLIKVLLLPLFLAVVHSKTSRNDETTRIVGGELASPGEFPYQIFIENVINSSEILKCGGALYSNEYVVTAAHCMWNKDTKKYASPKKVWITMGTNDLSEGSEAPQGDINMYKRISRVVEVIPHPKFEFKQFEGDLGVIPTFDIALLRLTAPVELNERTQPIPFAPSDFVAKGNATVTGWGRQDPYGKWTRKLRKVDIPMVEWKQCARLFKGYGTVTEDMFCTGTREGGLTPCNGDSGGPVACRDPSDPTKYFLCGIASWGPNRCPNYSVYTRVAKYVQWAANEVAQRSKPMST